MKMPFVSRKKYEIARENLKVVNKEKSDLRKSYIEIQEQTQKVLNDMDYMQEKEKDYKKEIKRLKSLLTRNGIEYKKEEN